MRQGNRAKQKARSVSVVQAMPSESKQSNDHTKPRIADGSLANELLCSASSAEATASSSSSSTSAAALPPGALPPLPRRLDVFFLKIKHK